MYESLIFALLLIMLNIIFGIKPHPIFGGIVAFMTFFISVTYFVTDTTLPLNTPNPMFTIFVLIIAGANAVCQIKDYRKK